ncbi:MAG: toll/interleukin-1 receptor domain-containing protein [Reyranellaceae bacterium]
MRIFISWSGPRSQALAKALHAWLPLVVHYVDPWLSHSDVKAGDRWAIEIAKELETSNFGIICITHENVDAPWILFEAGALAKLMQEGKVVPLLLDIEFKDVSGPLAQFQSKKVEKVGLKDVVESINKSAASPIPESRLSQLFEMLWPGLEADVTSIPKASTRAKQDRPQHVVLEELVTSIRGLDGRLRDSLEGLRDSLDQRVLDSDEPRSKRPRRMHPGLFRDVAHFVGESPNGPLSLLLMASLIREDIPWLYELILDYYRASASGGNPEDLVHHRQRLERALDMMRHGPYLEELSYGARDSERVLHEIRRSIEIQVNEAIPATERRRRGEV